MIHGGSIYIMANKLRTTLYIGVTADLRARIIEHKEHHYKKSFTDKYNCELCMYYEHYPTIQQAIAREKEIKKWRREKKDALINTLNPKWEDLWNEIKEW